MTRFLFIFGTLSAIAWASVAAITTMELFPALDGLHATVEVAAYILTTITATIALAFLILDLALPSIFRVQPSGLFRTITILILSIVVSGTMLSLNGYDVGAFLTTSAILAAIIGLALQPTLGSLFSGMALSSVRNLKTGSMLVLNENWVKVEATHWRHVKGRSADGSEVFIPNSVLAQSMFSIFPEDRSTRFDVLMHLPPNVPPQTITDALVGAFTDIEQLDSSKPVKVVPFEMRPDLGSTIYRIRLFARDYDLIYDLKGEVLRRAWYVLDRIGVHQPRNYFIDAPTWKTPSKQELLAQARPNLAEDVRRAIAEDARVHRFAPLEFVEFPASEAGRIAIIAQGHVTQGSDHFLSPVEFGQSSVPYLPPIPAYHLSADAEIRQIAETLARFVGPVAEQLMRTAVRTTQSIEDLTSQLATQISDDSHRDIFLAETRKLRGRKEKAGADTVVRLVQDPTGAISVQPKLRAISEIVVMTLPEKWMETLAAPH